MKQLLQVHAHIESRGLRDKKKYTADQFPGLSCVSKHNKDIVLKYKTIEPPSHALRPENVMLHHQGEQ